MQSLRVGMGLMGLLCGCFFCPLAVEPMKIRDIKILLETNKEGQGIYSRELELT